MHFIDFCDLPRRSFIPWTSEQLSQDLPFEGKTMPATVAYSAAAMPSLHYQDPDAAIVGLISYLQEHLTLHKRIREQGGAYGSGASHHALSGYFSFYAYRDPNVSSSYAAFKESMESLMQGEFSQEDIEEAKLSFLQDLDAPVSPASRAITAYEWLRQGRSYALREHYRSTILKVEKEKIMQVLQRCFSSFKESLSFVSFAGEELFLREKESFIQEHGKELALTSLVAKED